jgi:hypothetical protein
MITILSLLDNKAQLSCTGCPNRVARCPHFLDGWESDILSSQYNYASIERDFIVACRAHVDLERGLRKYEYKMYSELNLTLQYHELWHIYSGKLMYWVQNPRTIRMSAPVSLSTALTDIISIYVGFLAHPHPHPHPWLPFSHSMSAQTEFGICCTVSLPLQNG